MTDNTTHLIVGGGLAAAKAAETLRGEGFEGRLVLVGAETHLPYERPPLSKGFLLGTNELDEATVLPRSWYDENNVELRLGTTVTGLDPQAHQVTTETGQLAYDRLLLVTGATPRHLAMADESGAPTTYLRSIEDSISIKQQLQPGRRVTIIGAGWIGLEVASAARAADCQVTVIEVAEPLIAVVGPELSRFFADLHRSHGVDLRTNVSVAAVDHDSGGTVVRLGDGSAVPADLLVVGVGVSPNVGLAEAGGLRVENGIVVDEHLRSSHSDVFAAGDVANAYHPVLGRQVRVEHWDNAIEQGRTAARNMLDASEAYTRLPYFFTDQYDLGLEYVGNVSREGYDEIVVRGDLATQVFTAFWVKDSCVLAGMHVNDWDAIDSVREVVSRGKVDLSRLRDESVPLADLVD